jgi:prepilin-type N-terminal cleavage/methylation domain-containing protein
MPSRSKSGFSLLELVVVLTMLGLVGGTIGSLLLRQQRFYRGASELLFAREGVRDAIDVLATDIRGIAVSDTVRLLADSAIEMFSSIGSSVVCERSSDTRIAVPQPHASGNTLTSLLIEPDTGDLALFYRDTALNAVGWERHRIARFSSGESAATCPGFQLELSAPLSPDVHPGTPVRFIRRGRYSLYRAADGDWYLGYRRCNALGPSTCGSVQPLSGPYRGYSTDRDQTGLLFEYFDAHGGRLTGTYSPLELARVDVTVRAESRQRLVIERRSMTAGDSATVSIAIRNRTR